MKNKELKTDYENLLKKMAFLVVGGAIAGTAFAKGIDYTKQKHLEKQNTLQNYTSTIEKRINEGDKFIKWGRMLKNDCPNKFEKVNVTELSDYLRELNRQYDPGNLQIGEKIKLPVYCDKTLKK